MELRLDGQVAVITGSSMGIGKAIARSYGLAGARVVINSRDGPRLLLSLKHGLHAAEIAGGAEDAAFVTVVSSQNPEAIVPGIVDDVVVAVAAELALDKGQLSGRAGGCQRGTAVDGARPEVDTG